MSLPKRRKRERFGTREEPQIRCGSHLAWLRGHACSVGGASGNGCGGRIEAAKRMMREHKTACIHGADDIPNDWLVSFASCERHAFAFLFIETGPVTNVKLREFRKFETFAGQGMTSNMYWHSGMQGFRRGVELYAQYMQEFGPDKPWIVDEPMKPFTDQDFPLYMFNGV